MNKESSNTLVKRGRYVDKLVIMLGVAIIVGVITFVVFEISHTRDNKDKNAKTESTKVEDQIDIIVE